MELNTRNFIYGGGTGTANTVDFMAGLRLKDTTGSKYGPHWKVRVCMRGHTVYLRVGTPPGTQKVFFSKGGEIQC